MEKKQLILIQIQQANAPRTHAWLDQLVNNTDKMITTVLLTELTSRWHMWIPNRWPAVAVTFFASLAEKTGTIP